MFCALFTAALALLSVANAHAHGKQKRAASSTASAFNPTLTNLVPNAPGGPTLYYNGSGPVPPYDELSPSPLPLPPLSVQEIEDDMFNQLVGIAAGNGLSDNCSQCIAATELMHLAAITQPVQTVVNLLIRACNAFPYVYDQIYASSCEEEYAGVGNTGAYLAQLFAKMSTATNDMQGYCYWNWYVCDLPPAIAINETQYFSPKPESASVAVPPSGKTIKVLHVSDWHLDPRYDIGSEGNCSQYLCCRPYATNTELNTGVNNASIPASRFGYLFCDSPPDLALSAFSEMPKFVNMSDIAFTIFTGDIVSHDNADQLSRAYIQYEEEVTYQTFKAWMGDIPIYATLGNHDTIPEAFNSPNNINGDPSGYSNAFSWNYDLLSTMWATYDWIDYTAETYAMTHYGAYSYVTPWGLKIVSINTDFWYAANIFNYYNMTNPDNSGVLAFLAQELEASEAIGQRVWIIGHVLPGYNFGQALPNPTALFYSIVERFSPATIAGVFFGHTHEDQLMIYYQYLPNSTIASNSSTAGVLRNTTLVDFSAPLMVGYIGPSITPLTGYNAGWVLLEVDAETFEVVNMQTYIANVSEAATWDAPVWEFEYDARAAYDPLGEWPADAPLNGSFWHRVTENMLTNISYVEAYNLYETKSSIMTENCSTTACAEQKVCYLRSGQALLGYACPSNDGPY